MAMANLRRGLGHYWRSPRSSGQNPPSAATNTPAAAGADQELGECTVGIDFGASTSKVSLAWITNGGKKVSRVPYIGDIDGADYPRESYKFRFIASAVLEGKELRLTNIPPSRGTSISLKTILMYQAGICSETLRRAPDGNPLLENIDSGRITMAMCRDALHGHHRLLRKMAMEQAAAPNRKMKITQVVLTYPNFLCESEGAQDFRLYMKTYRRMIHHIWGSGVRVLVGSEGQNTACM